MHGGLAGSSDVRVAIKKMVQGHAEGQSDGGGCSVDAPSFQVIPGCVENKN